MLPKWLKNRPNGLQSPIQHLPYSEHKANTKKTFQKEIETWLARWTGSALRLGIGRTADRSGISHTPTNKSWNKESDSMPCERQKLDSTRWAWPPVDEGNTNTSTQWSTTSCHQVVFACAFGAVSTTRREACFSTMKTWGNYCIAFSTSPWDYGFSKQYGNCIVWSPPGLSMLACKSHAMHLHVQRCVCSGFKCFHATTRRYL